MSAPPIWTPLFMSCKAPRRSTLRFSRSLHIYRENVPEILTGFWYIELFLIQGRL